VDESGTSRPGLELPYEAARLWGGTRLHYPNPGPAETPGDGMCPAVAMAGAGQRRVDDAGGQRCGVSHQASFQLVEAEAEFEVPNAGLGGAAR
jgi:hypothetical protein